MQAGELPAEPEVDIDSRPRATEKRDASNSLPSKTKGAPSKSKSAKGKTVARKEYKFFDLSALQWYGAFSVCVELITVRVDRIPNRKTLASSGLRPQSYSEDELEDMGM